MFQAHGGRTWGAEMLLVGGLVFQYVGTRFSMYALGRPDGQLPGRLAVAQWMPLAATALAALAMGRPDMAVCLVFGSSVAALSLVMGMVTYVAPPAGSPRPQWRLWAMVLPPAILLLLAGFHGRLTWYHAVMLLVMGGAFLSVWVERRPEHEPSLSLAGPPAAVHVPEALLAPALVLAGVGAFAIIKGTGLMNSRGLTPELLAATILSPLLLLPSLGAGTLLAQQGHTDRAITGLCGTVLLNLCLLLPVVVLLQYGVGGIHGHADSMRFPLITWRVDAVLLVVLSFALLPVAAGRWMPERVEAVLLITVYVGYVFAEAALTSGFVGR